MNLLAKMERKFGRYAIPNLMRYMTAISLAGSLLGLFQPGIYYNYLSFNVYEILHGQVWRLVTFLLYPSVQVRSGFLMNIVFYGLMLYIFLWIGGVLEQAWGSFRFNLFYFSGILLQILVMFGYYFIVVNANGSGLAQVIGFNLAVQFDLGDLNYSMFLIFAFLFPNVQFLLYFIIPIKARWLAIINLVVYAADIIACIQEGSYLSYMSMFLLMAVLLNFVIFLLIARNPQGIAGTMRQKKRRVVYREAAREQQSKARHRCAICGRTEKDAPQLEFRYCSKCEGNYEYCSDHLFTHEHVKH